MSAWIETVLLLPGKHRIAIQDERGRKAETTLDVADVTTTVPAIEITLR